MLQIHKRAAFIANPPEVAWHHFLQSRFVGRVPDRARVASLAVVIQTLSQQSETHADLRGLTEHSWDESLPVVFEFSGSLLLDTRELTLHELHPNQPGRHFSGHFSENGRVMTLRGLSGDGKLSKEFHLIQEQTLALLTGG
jgi:hypothetical protein